MADDAYEVRDEPAFAPLALIDVAATAADSPTWLNQALTRVNDTVVRLSVMDGDFHWHQHPDDDEFFFVVSGELVVELEGRAPVVVGPSQGVTVPRGTVHRTRSNGRTAVLVVESAALDPTGS